MDNIEEYYLSGLNLLSTNFRVLIKVDRILNKEHVWIVGPRKSPMKELISVDAIVFDQRVRCTIMWLLTIFIIVICNELTYIYRDKKWPSS